MKEIGGWQGLQNQVVKVTTWKTEEVVAKEYDISPRTVRLSADLYKTVEAIKKAAPEVAEKLEFLEIKVSCKDIVVIGKALQQAYPEKKGQILLDLKVDFKKASKIAK